METTTQMAEKWQWMGTVLGDGTKQLDNQKLRRIPSSAKFNSNHSWGRNRRKSWKSTLGCLAMVTSPPLLVSFSWIALEYFDGSLAAAANSLFSNGLVQFMSLYAPAITPTALFAYATWVLFQGILYSILPGKGTGQLTPAGTLLEYNINGFKAWQLTVGLAIAAMLTGVVDMAIITDHWEGLLVTANIYGYLLTIFAYVKAHVAPSHAADRKFSGSAIYDFYMGIEMNPRFGRSWDWKLFHNGRPGIIGWTLIDMAYTALQYRKFGYVTKSMMIVDILHTMYVVDFFINEDWYLRTIDICHDHFGFYLAWGSAAWLPTMYTLQVQYLARNPVEMSWFKTILTLGLGMGGYVLFRSVNHQKDLVRRTKGDCTIWGSKAKFVRAPFKTSDGVNHESLLLTSGWWGMARHANYVGDLMLSFAMCLTCGFTHLLPWSYAIFMTAILIHRCHRDEKRCSAKYGATWAEYCRQVRWRLIPGRPSTVGGKSGPSVTRIGGGNRTVTVASRPDRAR